MCSNLDVAEVSCLSIWLAVGLIVKRDQTASLQFNERRRFPICVSHALGEDLRLNLCDQFDPRSGLAICSAATGCLDAACQARLARFRGAQRLSTLCPLNSVRTSGPQVPFRSGSDLVSPAGSESWDALEPREIADRRSQGLCCRRKIFRRHIIALSRRMKPNPQTMSATVRYKNMLSAGGHKLCKTC